MTTEEKADAFDRMITMMREQRDQFFTRGGSLGSQHGERTRHTMGNLLDWFLVEYAGDPRAALVAAFMESRDET